jgi:hypothetical protein
MSAHHPDARVVEVAQKCVDRSVLDQDVGAHHEQDRCCGCAEEEVDRRRLALALRLLDEADARVVVGDVAHDRDRSILAAACNHDELRDVARVQLLAEDRADRVGDVRLLVVGHDPDAARHARPRPRALGARIPISSLQRQEHLVLA